MSSPEQGDVVQQYSCRCHNISINVYNINASLTATSEPDYQRVFVGEDGIHITHHYLTLRTRDRAQESKNSPNKLLQHLALCCLACKTLAYRVAQEISPGSEAREGPVVPTEDWVEQETLRSKSGWVEVFVGPGGCLAGKHTIEQHFSSMPLSSTFSIGVLSQPMTPGSPPVASSPWTNSSPDNSVNSSTPTHILPPLLPLFPPPPFTPSHPVFLSLSTRATAKSADLRQRAEEETRAFVKSQLDALEKEESQLRKEVEGIWRGYREGWKDMLGRFNEERRRSLTAKPESSMSTSSARSGVPMSIRDFSPIVRSHPQIGSSHRASSQKVPLPSTSLLSVSLVQSSTHLPTSLSSRSPAPERPMSGSAAHSSITGAPNSSTALSSHVNGTHSSRSSSSMSPKVHGDIHLPGAFKRNMDTNVDIASSVKWAQGEEEMRQHLEGREDGEPRERARKRTSKNLGIGAVETNTTSTASTQPIDGSGKGPDSRARTQSGSETRAKARVPSPDGQPAQPPTSPVNGMTRRSKRRVTFDVEPEVAIVRKATAEQHRKPVAEVELFDLDDLSSIEPDSQSHLLHSSKPVRPQPVTRTPSYKLRQNDIAVASSVSQPASLPAPRAIPPRSPVNGNSKWVGGSARRSVGLADALPLLSSSVPAGDRVLAKRTQETTHERQRVRSPRTPSPPLERSTTSHMYVTPNTEEDRTPSPAPPSISSLAIEPAEAELKHLLAASAPSHRHAWKEGGRAWEMFHQRSRDKKKIKGTIAEEDSEHTSSSLEDSSDDPSDESPTHGPWRNPSHFANSLPVQIRPLAQYQPTLEPKTSLTDKQGVLVPALKVAKTRLNSATAIRKAVYAERDRTRSIDPGPTLDFDEQEEIEEDDILNEIGDGDRGRRHALSILQARSVVPEAGMWRSMAS